MSGDGYSDCFLNPLTPRGVVVSWLLKPPDLRYAVPVLLSDGIDGAGLQSLRFSSCLVVFPRYVLYNYVVGITYQEHQLQRYVLRRA